MIISHNLIALNTLNSVKKNQIKQNNTISKLSSGLRINKASDDAAGLAISEKIRSQIRGLQQAQRNVQDGISLIQTAEGSMNEIQNINHRMRELCLQGSNDTLTDKDRENIQEELNQLKEEINKIADNTHFNEKKLIDGSLELESIPKTPLGFEWKVDFNSPKKLTTIVPTTDGGMIVGGTNDISASHHDPSNTRSPYLAKLNSEGKIEWELEIPKDGEYNIVYDIKQINDSDEYILTTRSNYEVSPGVRRNKNIFYKIDGSGNILNKIDNGYDNYSFCINQNSDGTFVETGNTGSSFFVRTYDSSFNSTDYKSFSSVPSHFRAGMDIKKTHDGGYIMVGQENDAGNEYGLAVKLNADLTIAWETKILNDSFSSVVELNNGEFMVLGTDLYKFDSTGNSTILNSDITYSMDSTLNSHPYIIKTQDGDYLVSSATQSNSTNNKLFKLDENGNEIWNIPMSSYDFHLASIAQLNNSDFAVLGDNQVFKYTSDNYSIDDKNLYIQIGANRGQSITINIDSMKPTDLGYINGFPSVIPRDNATISIGKIDKAISTISSNRSYLGAFQNRLEHTLDNNANYEENLIETESCIRDVDMAKEILKMTSNNILLQASQAMLTQANQLPNTVISLLSSK